jgi:hypothetical protein
MELVLQRVDADPYRTHGRLLVDRDDFCYTLEDAPARLAREGKGCIPAGRYEVRLTQSPRASRGGLWTPWPDGILPLVVDVPGFEGIRFHAGNTADHTEGCILVGLGRTTDAITQSRPALIKLRDELTMPAWITIIDVEG